MWQKIRAADGHKLFHSRRTLLNWRHSTKNTPQFRRKTQGSIYRLMRIAVVLHNKGELFESEIASEVLHLANVATIDAQE